jgi:hypothetical protein
MVMLPPNFKKHRRMLQCYCQWCARVQSMRGAYKLRDGPVDWYFCNDEHALEWLDHRHKTPGINDLLRKAPGDRRLVLGELTIAEFCQRELSQRQARLDAVTSRSDSDDGLRNLDRMEVPLSEDA